MTDASRDSERSHERRVKRLARRYGVSVMKCEKPIGKVLAHGGYMLREDELEDRVWRQGLRILRNARRGRSVSRSAADGTREGLGCFGGLFCEVADCAGRALVQHVDNLLARAHGCIVHVPRKSALRLQARAAFWQVVYPDIAIVHFELDVLIGQDALLLDLQGVKADSASAGDTRAPARGASCLRCAGGQGGKKRDGGCEVKVASGVGVLP